MREFLKRVARAFSGEAGAPIVDSSNVSTLTAEVRDAIDAAGIVPREFDDDGPRVAVISRTLRGAFVFSREEGARRIRKAFPELDDHAVVRAVRYLENRVVLSLRPRVTARRKNGWVHGWKDEGDGFR